MFSGRSGHRGASFSEVVGLLARIRRGVVALSAVLSMVVGAVLVAAPPVAASAPGEVWTSQTASESNNWYSVTYGKGLFVATSITGSGTNRVMTSPDGVTWTGRTAAENNNWASVTYGNGLFVAVAYSGSNRVMTSPDGVTWTAQTAAVNNSWFSVTYGNGLFVAVSGNGTNRVMTSPDGVNWTSRAMTEASTWRSVIYANGLFVAVASAGTNRVMTSPNGESWTARPAAVDNYWQSVSFGNGLFVAVASAGTNRVMTSPDGATWTAQTAAEDNGWLSVTFGSGLFVATSNSGSNRVMTSPDGVTWTARSAAAATIWSSVTFGNGLFVAVSMGSVVMTSGSLGSAPSAPTGLYATAGDGSASIAFTAGADGGAAISKYQVKVGNGSWTDVVGTTSPITVTGLTNYATVAIRLRAVNSVGAGAASTAVQVWPRIAGSSLTSVNVEGSSKVRASFAALTPVGGTTSHYWVYAYTKGTNTIAGSCRSTPIARSCAVTGLSANTEYDVAVRGFFSLTGSPTVLPTTDSARQTVRTNS